MKPIIAFLTVFLAIPVSGQQAVLIVTTSHPDVTILVDGKFKGQKNTREHVLRWHPPAGVIYRVPVQATFRGDVKTQTVDIECGKTVRISFDFPQPPKDPPVLPPPNCEQTITIKHDPIEITGQLETVPLKTEILRVEPLKIEMEPLEIILRGDGGVLPDPNRIPGEPSNELSEQISTQDYSLFLMATTTILVLSLVIFQTRVLMIQGKLHRELVECLHGSRSRSIPQSAPPSGDLEVEA